MGLRQNNSTINSLQQMSSSFPAANQRVAQGLQQGREAQLRQAVAGAAKAGQPLGAPQVQQIAGEQRAAQAQATLGQAQQAVQSQAQMGQQAIQAQGLEQQQRLQAQSQQLSEQARKNQETLSALSGDLKGKLFDRQMQFEKDNLGRTKFTEQQLMDWKLSKAQTDEELRDFEQEVTQLHERRMQLLSTAYKAVEAKLNQEFAKDESLRDQALTQKLVEAKQEAERRMAEAEAEAANRAAMFSGGTALLTAGAAAYFTGGNPVAITAAASGGAKVGEFIEGLTR